MKIFEKIKSKFRSSNFDETFADLRRMGVTVPSAKKMFEVLKELKSETSDIQSELLITEFHKIQYSSNTNSYFYFYFPIVSHILYFKPKYEKDILGFLVGPNFANGTTETKEIILTII
jgi:hypothetical protein